MAFDFSFANINGVYNISEDTAGWNYVKGQWQQQKQHHKQSVNYGFTHSGADTGTDHKAGKATLEIRLKKI